MNKSERKARVKEIVELIDTFLNDRKDSYERSIDYLNYIRCEIVYRMDILLRRLEIGRSNEGNN